MQIVFNFSYLNINIYCSCYQNQKIILVLIGTNNIFQMKLTETLLIHMK